MDLNCKPIFVIRAPIDKMSIREMQEETMSAINFLKENYYVFIVTEDRDDYGFEMFSPSMSPEMTEEKLKELEKLIRKELKND